MKNYRNFFFLFLVFLLQLILSDYVHLGPWLYVCLVPFLVLNIPLSRPPHVVMLIAFGIGILLDVLSDGAPGLNAFAAVMAAAPRRFFYRSLVNGDRQDKTEIVRIQEVGMLKYLKCLAALTAVYMAAYILLDCVSFRPLSFILVKFIASTAVCIAISLLLAIPFGNRN